MGQPTNNFFGGWPGSNDGNSCPLSRSIARTMASGDSNSAKPKPCGFPMGVRSRLNDRSWPQAYSLLATQYPARFTAGRTEKRVARKSSVIPDDIDPTNNVVIPGAGVGCAGGAEY